MDDVGEDTVNEKDVRDDAVENEIEKEVKDDVGEKGKVDD